MDKHAKAYVVGMQPGFDYRPAREYVPYPKNLIELRGPLFYSNELGVSHNRRIVDAFRKQLRDYVAGRDFIIPSGDPSRMLAIGQLLAEKGPVQQYLKYDRDNHGYVLQVLDFSPIVEDSEANANV